MNNFVTRYLPIIMATITCLISAYLFYLGEWSTAVMGFAVAAIFIGVYHAHRSLEKLHLERRALTDQPLNDLKLAQEARTLKEKNNVPDCNR